VKRLLYPLSSLAAAVGVGIYAAVSLGRVNGSAVFLVLTTHALAWVVWMLFRTAHALVREPEAIERARASGKRRKELEREKQALMKALKELEFDHEMGKVSDVDYQEIGGNYRARAVRVMRQLDLNAGEVDYRSLVERDVKSRMAARGASKTEEPARPSASMRIAEKPSCPSCSTENDRDAIFCKKCGHRFAAEEVAK
jgi:hypothetical protein